MSEKTIRSKWSGLRQRLIASGNKSEDAWDALMGVHDERLKAQTELDALLRLLQWDPKKASNERLEQVSKWKSDIALWKSEFGRQ